MVIIFSIPLAIVFMIPVLFFDYKSDAENEAVGCLIECSSCDHCDIYYLED